MRYAITKKGSTEIVKIITAPAYLIAEITPADEVATVIEDNVFDSTHVIVNGKAVLKEST